MAVLRVLKSAVPEPIRRLIRGPDRLSTREALGRIASRSLEINTVIDVGASDGRWSAIAEEFWPAARYHLIEAFDHWRPMLAELAARKPNYSYNLAAAGRHAGTTRFALGQDPYGGSAAPDIMAACYRSVPMVSIDDEVRLLSLPPPYLIKLDTHGSEREIIEGATETLKNTALFVNEFYNFQSEERRWPQMVALVESLGFRCVDIIEPLWRHDAVLWQMDFAFIRSDRPEFFNNEFSTPLGERRPRKFLIGPRWPSR